MHIKTNIEGSSVQIAVLAICPLITVINSVNDALFFVAMTVLCVILSQLFCLIFNKYLSKNIKTMLTAIISAFLVVIVEILAKEQMGKTLPANAFFVVFSATVLSLEFNYFKIKARTKFFMLSVLKSSLIFAVISFVFAIIKEFLSSGMIYGYSLFEFKGLEFFGGVVFSLILLGFLCFLFDMLVRWLEKEVEARNLVYQKYVKIIRDEKAFQYDKLRREKLLINEIEVNNINRADAEKLIAKESENESVESVKETIEDEEGEIVVPEEPDAETKEEKQTEKQQTEQVEEGKSKKNKKNKKEKGGKK